METPEPQTLGALTASVMEDRGQDKRKRWYWRVRKGSKTLKAGRFHEREIPRLLSQTLGGSGGAGSSRARATVADLLDAWMVHQRERQAAGRIKAATLTTYELAAESWIGSDIGTVRVDELTVSMVERVVLEWEAYDGVGVRTSRKMVKRLSAAWKWGVENHGLPRLEIARAAPKIDKKTPFVYRHGTPERHEAIAMLNHMECPISADAVRLLMFTGARISEVLALREPALDWDAEVVWLGTEEGAQKTGERAFPVGEALGELLDRLLEAAPKGDPLIARKGTYVRAQMLKACAAAGIEDITPHGIRRMVATELVRVTNPKTAAELTGHSVAVLMEIYVTPTDADRRMAVAVAGLDRLTDAKVIELPGTHSGHKAGHTTQGD